MWVATAFYGVWEMKVDGNLIEWVGSFLSDRRLQFVIDGHYGDEVKIEISLRQGSLVSLILFAIYLSGVFKFVEENTNRCLATSFADDCGSLAEASNTPQLVRGIKWAENLAVGWGIDNHLQFDYGKTETVLTTKRRKIKNIGTQIFKLLIKTLNLTKRPRDG